MPYHSTNVPEKSASRNSDQSGSWEPAARQACAVDGRLRAANIWAELNGELDELYMILSFYARALAAPGVALLEEIFNSFIKCLFY
jgi:hypothetical protein